MEGKEEKEEEEEEKREKKIEGYEERRLKRGCPSSEWWDEKQARRTAFFSCAEEEEAKLSCKSRLVRPVIGGLIPTIAAKKKTLRNPNLKNCGAAGYSHQSNHQLRTPLARPTIWYDDPG